MGEQKGKKKSKQGKQGKGLRYKRATPITGHGTGTKNSAAAKITAIIGVQ